MLSYGEGDYTNRQYKLFSLTSQVLRLLDYTRFSLIPQDSPFFSVVPKEIGAGVMAQQLRILTALPVDLVSVPRNHVAAHNCPGDLTSSYTNIHMQTKTPMACKIQ